MGIPLFKVGMSGLAPRFAQQVLMSGYIGQGPKVDEFEREFEKLNGFPEGSFVSTNSCTSAIELVLRHLNVGPDSRVACTPMTCIATAAPILNQRAKVCWAGVTHKGLIRVEDVKLHGELDAIIGVDWTGRLPDYRRLKTLGVPVIQDAAHDPFLAEYEPEELGDFVCFSFGPIKHLTTIDGGGVFVNSALYRDEIVKALKLLRWYGLDRTSSKDFRCEQDIEEPGMKWHMNDVSAAVGLANLRNLKDIVAVHRQHARMLEDGIDNPWISTYGYDPRSNYWVYPLVVPEFRDHFVKYMNANGVGCSRVHRRGDTHPGYSGETSGLKMIKWFDDNQANLPCGWWMSIRDVNNVVAIANAFNPEKVPM